MFTLKKIENKCMWWKIYTNIAQCYENKKNAKINFVRRIEQGYTR